MFSWNNIKIWKSGMPMLPLNNFQFTKLLPVVVYQETYKIQTIFCHLAPTLHDVWGSCPIYYLLLQPYLDMYAEIFLSYFWRFISILSAYTRHYQQNQPTGYGSFQENKIRNVYATQKYETTSRNKIYKHNHHHLKLSKYFSECKSFLFTFQICLFHKTCFEHESCAFIFSLLVMVEFLLLG